MQKTDNQTLALPERANPTSISNLQPWVKAKRKREAVLTGPCPCGSRKTARLCCFNGQGWHKPPAVLGLKALPATGRVEKCYMKELGSCVPPISAEHIISDSVCRVLMGESEFSISGVPWLEAGETNGPASGKMPLYQAQQRA